MKMHTVRWYESDDGKIFDDEIECLTYETKELYKQSGIRFYDQNGIIEDLIVDHDYTYNHSQGVIIDRKDEKKEQNDRFIFYVRYFLGWCLAEKAYVDGGSKYRFSLTDIVKES